jgi:predicted TIM-barrel enzyme
VPSWIILALDADHAERIEFAISERRVSTPVALLGAFTVPITYTAGTMDTRGVINSLFGVPRALVGVVHTGGLPGTPAGDRSIAEIVETAVAEARVYASAGFHGVMIENTHDRPYLKGSVGPEIVAALAVIGHEVRRAAALPLGVQVLAGANRCTLAVALACGASFVRVEGFVFAHVADEGIIESSAGKTRSAARHAW